MNKKKPWLPFSGALPGNLVLLVAYAAGLLMRRCAQLAEDSGDVR